MTNMTFLLYGANGYTGQLIARRAKEFGLTPILAGRSGLKVKALAEELGLEYLELNLNDAEELDEALWDVEVVLNAAGPFAYTARPMMEACLRTETHYLDITGEIVVFETAYRLDNEANGQRIMLMPGVGFDIVPSDCMAVFLKKLLPDATELRLAFASKGSSVSRGTALTMVEGLGNKGAVRQNGRIVRVPLGHKTLHFPCGEKKCLGMTFPWGDVSTAFYSTEIPNIEIYVGISPTAYRNIRISHLFNRLLRTRLVRNFIRRQIDKRPAGPSAEQRANGRTYVWGEVRNAAGEVRQATMETPESYELTCLSSLLILKKVLSDNFKTGFQTPAKVYGEDLILEIPGVLRREITVNQ